MNIAFLVKWFPVLSETFILNQITGLIDRGHNVDIFARQSDNDSKIHADILRYNLLDRTYYYEIPVPRNYLLRFIRAVQFVITNSYRRPHPLIRSLNLFKYGQQAASLRKLYEVTTFLSYGPYDIIHCHYGPNGLIGVKMRNLGAIQGKVVVTFHGYDIRLGIEKGADFYAKLRGNVDCFFSISSFNKKYLQCFGFDPSKIFDLPVGIDVRKFPFKWLEKGSSNNCEIKVLTVARLVIEKGLEYGIKSLKRVVEKFPTKKISWKIIGEGYQRGELEKLITDLSLDGVVSLPGSAAQDVVRKELLNADIFLLPSIKEVLPVCLMEALATGLPVVASEVGSVHDLVKDGEMGFLANVGDVDSIADRLEYLIEHPDVWPEMGRSGRKHIKTNYDIEKLNDRLVKIYEGILQKK
jgi:colanic acid/amylovoran biosynthesis glycosyltransferase